MDRFDVLEEGGVAVTVGGVDVRSLAAGGSFGEVAPLRDVPRPTTVTATNDLVLRAVDRPDLIAAMTGHGEATARAEGVDARLPPP